MPKVNAKTETIAHSGISQAQNPLIRVREKARKKGKEKGKKKAKREERAKEEAKAKEKAKQKDSLSRRPGKRYPGRIQQLSQQDPNAELSLRLMPKPSSSQGKWDCPL